MRDFTGAAKRIDDIDLGVIGREIGVGEDEIHAVIDVEAAGSGFDSLGRPQMLFEPHVFYRELRAGPARAEAEREGIAYPKWRHNYPKDSYPRLNLAIAICQRHGVSIEKALRSASWGLGQVMGFNHAAAGYPSAEAMVRAFMDDEEAQLRGMVNFIVANGLDKHLRAHDWRGFARGYNGSGFEKNGYHTKLAARYAWWQARPDTPIPANLRLGSAERPPRQSLLSSSTLQAAGVTGASVVGGAATVMGSLEREAQIVAIIAVTVAALGLAWIARERIRYWAQGVR